jgi:hypothetical protein
VRDNVNCAGAAALGEIGHEIGDHALARLDRRRICRIAIKEPRDGQLKNAITPLIDKSKPIWAARNAAASNETLYPWTKIKALRSAGSTAAICAEIASQYALRSNSLTPSSFRRSSVKVKSRFHHGEPIEPILCDFGINTRHAP